MLSQEQVKAMKTAVSAKFILADEVAQMLAIGLRAEKSILLHGRGGLAKSAIVETALKAAGVDYATFGCGEGS